MILGRRELSAILLALAAIVFYLVLLSTRPSGAQTGGITTNLTGVTANQVPQTNPNNRGNQSGAKASAGGAKASSKSGRKQEPTVINVPNKPLPPSGGLPVYAVVAGSALAGVGLLALGLVIRHGSRR